jgi:hypothetical protein
MSHASEYVFHVNASAGAEVYNSERVLTDPIAKHAAAKFDISAFHDRGRYRKLFLSHLSDMATIRSELCR